MKKLIQLFNRWYIKLFKAKAAKASWEDRLAFRKAIEEHYANVEVKNTTSADKIAWRNTINKYHDDRDKHVHSMAEMKLFKEKNK